MNSKALTLSLVMAALAVFFVQSYVTSKEEEQKKRYGTEVLVLSAAKDINELETINETHLALKIVPKRFLDPSAISFDGKSKDEATIDMKELVGSVAMVPIRKGEQLSRSKLTEPGARSGLSPQVSPGKRAVAISIDDRSAVSKLIKPGDRVDIIATLDPTGQGKLGMITRTILQDVLVLSVGSFVTNNVPRLLLQDGPKAKIREKVLRTDLSYSTVTLEVESTHAQAIALLQRASPNAITLALRNNDDTAKVLLSPITLREVLGGSNLSGRSPSSQ